MFTTPHTRNYLCISCRVDPIFRYTMIQKSLTVNEIYPNTCQLSASYFCLDTNCERENKRAQDSGQFNDNVAWIKNPFSWSNIEVERTNMQM